MNARRTYLAAAGLVAVTMTLTFTRGGSAAAQAKVDADRVVLEYQGGPNAPCLSSAPMTRVFPDGTRTPAFTVPPGKVLVLTDLAGVVRESVPWSAGRVASLLVSSTAGPFGPKLWAFGPVTPDAVVSGVVPVSVHTQSGVLLGPNLTLCVSGIALIPNGLTAAGVNQALAQGYLIPE